jgi:superfamily II DNA helicase RecQ
MELKWSILFLCILSSGAINQCQRKQILPLKSLCNLIPFRKYRMSKLFAKEKGSRKASPEKAALMEEVENVLLPKLFGHPKFRPGQREIISKILAGNEQT